MPNIIKQIVKEGADGTQTIKMIVRDNERGPQGAQGTPGVAATIEPGNAYSVPAGTQPSVINTGSPSAARFDFYIPQGAKGEKGDPGVASFAMTSVDPGEGVPLGANQFIAVYKP